METILKGDKQMDRQAKLREIDARCLVAASELPSEEADAKELLVRVARTVESQMEMGGMQDFDVTPGAPGERMQGVPAINGQPAQGSMLDGTQGPQLTPEQYRAVISLRIVSMLLTIFSGGILNHSAPRKGGAKNFASFLNFSLIVFCSSRRLLPFSVSS